MIIGINGKIGSGKDTIGEIIQGLCLTNKNQTFEIKKFAGKLKQIGSILTGITVEKFEDQEFKKALLGEEWGTVRHNPLNNIEPFEKFQFNELMSVREFLQKLGTEAMRDGLHTNVWVNALFADYKTTIPVHSDHDGDVSIYPNWIITDMRFPNEMDAVELREGITIKVVRYKVGDKVYWTDPEGVSSGPYEVTEVYQDFCFINNDFSEAQVLYHEIKLIAADLHPSETALDDAKFDYEIVNNGTIEDLVEEVRKILTKENII
jgi:hypothetical protein